MAEFFAPQIGSPDILGSYIRGQQGAIQSQMAPLQIAGAQQDLQAGALKMDQLRLMLRSQQMQTDIASRLYNASPGSSGAGAQSPSASNGGIQNGPQSAVSAPAQSSGSYNGSFNAPPVNTMMALDILQGRDPLTTAKSAQEYQLKQAQLQSQGPLNLIDSVFHSAEPAKVVMNNPSLISQWPNFARQLGVDPVKDFNDENVRKALALAGNNIRGQTGQPAKEYPVQLQTVAGGYGSVLQRDPVTGKETQVQGREMPSFSLKDVWDPTTNTTNAVPVQTGGWGMSGTNPAGGTTRVGSPSSGPGTGATPGVNLGYKPPSDAELKAAMFGSEMRSGLETLRSLESQGYSMSAAKRAAFINAATSEDAGIVHQLLGQEGLAKGFNAKDQQYMAAMMPMLQAAGHDQSGARLTTSQVRQNIEGLIPVDSKNKAAMEQVNKNRQGFYLGLLTQAGSATQLPQYKNSLASDLKSAQGEATGMRKTLGGKTYEKRDGKWYAL